MEYKADVIKNQKFDIGRTINPFICDCEKCDYLNCPKGNYAVKTKPHKYKTKDFCEVWHDKLVELARNHPYFDLTQEMFTDLIGDCISFPKGTYWGFGAVKKSAEKYEDTIYFTVTIESIVRGNVRTRAEINQFGDIIDKGMNETQWKLAERISKAIQDVRDYAEKNK